MQRALRVLIFLAPLSLVGCVGISALSETTESSSMYHYYTVTKDPIENQTDAERVLGTPYRKVELPFGKEEWIYRNGYNWRGIVVWAIVPIPLLAPAGHSYIRMIFLSDGTLSEAYAEEGGGVSIGCILPVECGDLESIADM